MYFEHSTNVSIFTYLPMGLDSDGPQQTQWSHVVEHLVIRSTVPGDLSFANAETVPDHMRLDFYGNLDNWTEGLSHHRRWLQGVPFTSENLAAEKPKVKSEGEYTVKNFATHKFAMAAWAQGVRHGQKHAAVQGDIDRVSLSEIQDYRDQHLAVLTNLVVCIVGGVHPDKARSATSHELGTIISRASPAPVRLHPGTHEMTWDLKARHLVLSWRIPKPDSVGFAALLTAANWLNLQFYSDVQLQKMTGMTISGTDLHTAEGDFFYVSTSLRPGSSFREVQERLKKHLSDLSSSSTDPWAFQLAQHQTQALTSLPDPEVLTAQLPAKMTIETLEGNMGLQWGMNEFRYGSQKAALVQHLSALTSESVRQAAKTYLSNSASFVVTLQPAAR